MHPFYVFRLSLARCSFEVFAQACIVGPKAAFLATGIHFYLILKSLVASEDYSGSTSSNFRSADFLELSNNRF